MQETVSLYFLRNTLFNELQRILQKANSCPYLKDDDDGDDGEMMWMIEKDFLHSSRGNFNGTNHFGVTLTN